MSPALQADSLPAELPGKPVKWNISCHIGKEGCHSYQGFQSSKTKFLSPRRAILSAQQPSVTSWSAVSAEELGGLEGGMRDSSGDSHTTTAYREHGIKNVSNQGADSASDSRDVYERNGFSEPRCLHLSKHRRVLNS